MPHATVDYREGGMIWCVIPLPITIVLTTCILSSSGSAKNVQVMWFVFCVSL
jgi:hypothetical protein